MNRKILLAYSITSILFLLFGIAFGMLRLRTQAEASLAAAHRELEAIRVSALSIYLVQPDFSSEYFTDTMRRRFQASAGLRLLAIYSRRAGLQYLLAVQQRLQPADPPQVAQWRGAPEYPPLRLNERRFTLPFNPSGSGDLFIDAVFPVLQPQDLYPVLRELFYVLLLYLLVTAVMLFVAALSSRSPRREPPASPLRAPGGTPPGEAASGQHSPAEQAPALYSPASGLCWHQHLAARLGAELERSASFDQDLALLLASLPAMQTDSGTRPARSARYNYRQLGSLTLEVFPFKDLAFEYDRNTIAVILPDKDIDQALREASRLRARIAGASGAGGKRLRPSIGIAARSGRLISPTRLLVEAAQALKRAQAQGAGQIIAFRADPERYRRQLLGAKSGS